MSSSVSSGSSFMRGTQAPLAWSRADRLQPVAAPGTKRAISIRPPLGSTLREQHGLWMRKLSPSRSTRGST